MPGCRQLFSVFRLTAKLRSTCAPLLEPRTVYTDVENKRSIPWNEILQFQLISFHNRIALTGAIIFLPQFYNISFSSHIIYLHILYLGFFHQNIHNVVFNDRLYLKDAKML